MTSQNPTRFKAVWTRIDEKTHRPITAEVYLESDATLTNVHNFDNDADFRDYVMSTLYMSVLIQVGNELSGEPDPDPSFFGKVGS